MTGKQLKNSILQWAIQGKLVPQDPNDEPASVLLERIREEKARLIKENKIKKPKNESIIYRGDDNSYYEKFADGTVKCIDDEIPFEIPESWVWARLENVVIINPKVECSDDLEAAFIPMEAISACYGSHYRYYKRLWKEIKNGYISFSDGDVALAKITPCFQNRKSMVLHDLPNGVGAGTTELRVLRPYAETVYNFYILYFLASPYFVEEARFKGTANQQRIIPGYLENKLFPIPPLEEQVRIVKTIEKIMPFAERFENTQAKLDDLNITLKKALKLSLLQEAIQGRLVPQCSEEEPASTLLQRINAEKERLIKEKKIKRDKQESVIFRGDDNCYFEKLSDGTVQKLDVPFDIPKNWEWVRCENIFNIWSARRVHESDWRSKGVPFYRAREIAQLAENGSVANDLYIDNSLYDEFSKNGVPQQGDLLVTAVGTLGKIFIVPDDQKFYFKDGSVICLSNFGKLNSSFLKFALMSDFFISQYANESQGTTVATLTMVRMKRYLLPIPPLEEQHRIVKHIKDLYEILS